MLRSLAIAALLMLPAALAQDGEGPAPEEPPWPTLSIPLPEAGDKLVYEVSRLAYVDGEMEVVEPPRVAERLVVHARGDVWDAWGSVRPAVSFSTHPATAARPTDWSTDMETGKHLFLTDYKGAEEEGDGYASTWNTATTVYRPEGGPQCGITHALQGHDGPAPSEIHLFKDACKRAYWGTFEGTGWRIDRIDGTGDEQTVAYRPTAIKGEGLVWFQNGNPYPVRFLDHDEEGQWTLLEMVAFERGPGAPAVRLKPLPPVEYRTIRPLDPGSMGTVWRLDAALGEAFEDPDVQAFLDDHPESYLRYSWFNERTHRSTHETGHTDTVLHGWYVALDDGDAALKLGIERTTVKEYLATPLGPQQVGNDSWVDVSLLAAESQGATWGQVAHTLPTPESARSRWAAWTPSDMKEQGANAFGHNLFCNPCLEPRGSTTAGRLMGEGSGEVSLLGSDSEDVWTWTGSYLFLEHDGRVSAHIENRVHATFEPVGWVDVPPLPVRLPTPVEEIIQDLLGGRSPGIPDFGERLHAEPGRPAADTADAEVAPQEATVAADPGIPVRPLLYGGAAAAGGIGLLLLWKFFGVALFSRITQDKALNHPVRGHLAELVQQHPGIHLMELVRRSGNPQGTVRHHMGKLVATGLVEARRNAAGVSFFPKGTGVHAKRAAEVLRSPSARTVQEAFRRDPALSVREVAGKTGLSARTVRYHAKRLRDHGAL